MSKKKACETCNNGTAPVAIVLADDSSGDVVWCDYCPMCGRDLKEV